MDDELRLRSLISRSGGLMSSCPERIIDDLGTFLKNSMRLLIHSGWKQIIPFGRTGGYEQTLSALIPQEKSCTSVQIQTFCYLDWNVGK